MTKHFPFPLTIIKITKFFIISLLLCFIVSISDNNVSIAAENRDTHSNGNDSTNKNFSVFSADSAECQQKNDDSNICTYSGNAVFWDKDAKLMAPIIVVYRNTGGQVTKIVAIGNKENKARYSNVENPSTTQNRNVTNNNSNNNDKLVDASADNIAIYPSKKLAIMEGDATIIQQRDTISGQHLEYDIEKKTILSKPKKSEKNQEKELITVFLYPNQ